MDRAAEIEYGLPAPTEAAGKRGGDVLRAIVDATAPARRTSTITQLGGAQ